MQQLAQFSQQHASECEQEIQELEQVALSVSNVQALPSAAKTVLEDLRVRSMTLGLFSNDDLYQAENFHHEEEHEEEEEDDSLLMDELEDTDHDDLGNGLFARYGVSGGGGGTSPRSRSPMFLGRLRSSTVRKFSTTTNISVDDEEEGGGGANKFGSPHTPPLGKSYRPLNSCGAPSAGIASKGRNTHSDEKTKKGGGGIAAQLSLSLPLEVTESPLHAHPVRPAAAAVLVVEHRGGGTAGDGTGTDEVKEDSPSPSPPADWTPRSSRSNSGRDNDEGGGGAMDAESPSRATPPEGYLINNATATSAQGLTNRSVSDDIGGTYNAIFSVAQHEQTAGNTGGSPVTPRSGYRSASGLQLPLFMGNLNLERPSTPPLPPPPLDVNNTPFQVHSVESPPHAVSRAFAAEPDEGPPGGELDRVERLPSSQK